MSSTLSAADTTATGYSKAVRLPWNAAAGAGSMAAGAGPMTPVRAMKSSTRADRTKIIVVQSAEPSPPLCTVIMIHCLQDLIGASFAETTGISCTGIMMIKTSSLVSRYNIEVIATHSRKR